MERMIKCDLLRSPILLGEVLPVEPTNENVDDYIMTLQKGTEEAEGDNLVWIIDISNGKYLKAELRQKFNDFFTPQEEHLKKAITRIKYIIYVNSNVMAGVLLKTILKFQKQVIPTRVVKTREEAYSIAEKELAAYQ